MRALLITGSLTVALLATGCVNPSEGTPSSDDLAQFGVDPGIVVDLDDAGFAPDTVELSANSTIAVTNVGEDVHAVMQVDTAPDRRIETGDLVPGETVDIHVADPGTMELTDPRSGATLTLDVGPPRPGR